MNSNTTSQAAALKQIEELKTEAEAAAVAEAEIWVTEATARVEDTKTMLSESHSRRDKVGQQADEIDRKLLEGLTDGQNWSLFLRTNSIRASAGQPLDRLARDWNWTNRS